LPTETSTPLPTPTSTPSPSPTALPTSTPTPAPGAELTATVFIAGTEGTPTATSLAQSTPTPVPTAAFGKDIVHILLIGGDGNYVPDMNTDTLIVAVVNKKTKLVSLLSIPRDLWVYIPTYGYGRINIAHRIGTRYKYPDGGGPGLLMRTIEENIGIHIDNWVRIGYNGFARAVDEVGGVDLIVACRTNLRYIPPTSEEEQEMILEPGTYHLDGATALRYVRTRRGDTDFERQSRQQQFLKGVWDEFRSTSIITKIPGLWSAMKGAFATDLSLGDVLALAPAILRLEPEHIWSRYIGRGQVRDWRTPGGAQVLLPIPEKIARVVARVYAPLGGEEPLAKEAARVQVQNGTQQGQLATIAADQLHWSGIKAVAAGPAERTDHKNTQILVYNDRPETVASLAQLLKVKPENVTSSPDPGQAFDIRVILGADYDPCK
jgi:LCP family protein required for cell wall assembly